MVRRLFSQRKSQTSSSAQQKQRKTRRMLLETLSSRELMAADLGVIDDGLRSEYLTDVQTSINSTIEAAPAPFIGDALATELGTSEQNTSQFADSLRYQIAENSIAAGSTVESVKAQLRSSFGIEDSAISVNGSDGDSDIRFTVELTGSASYDEGVTLELVGADPEIDLRAGGEDQVQLDLSWRYTLVFGVREADNGESEFYFDDAASNEVKIEFDATIKESFDAGHGKVGVFFGDIAVDNQAGDQGQAAISRFSGKYTLDVSRNADGNTQVAGDLTGSGEAYLDVRGSFSPNFDPSSEDKLIDLGITADASVKYDTDIAFETSGNVDWTDNHVEVNLDGVSVDLGKIYTDFVDPLVSDLQESLRPLKPMVDFLNAPLPVISDLYQLAGKGAKTAIDLVPDASKRSALRKTVSILNSLINYRGLAGASASSTEELLSFSLSKSGLDSNSAAEQQHDRENRLEYYKNNGLNIQLADKHKNPDDHAEWNRSLAWNAEFDGKIDLPFLTDSETLVGFMLGDSHSEFFTFDLAADINAMLSVDIPITALANMVSLTGGIELGLKVDLDGGYDATGISQLADAADYSSKAAFDASIQAGRNMLWNGFYLDDHNGNLDAGDNNSMDGHEAELSVEVSAGLKAGLDIIVASIEFGGQAVLDTNLKFDLNDLPEPDAIDGQGAPIWSSINDTQPSDWEYDGRVRYQELKTIVDDSPGALFNVNGTLEAGFDASVEARVLGFIVYSNEWELFRVTLIDASLSQPDDRITILGENPPQLGEVDDNGVLTLYTGQKGQTLRNVENGITDEHFTVQSIGESRSGGESFLVTFESPTSGEVYTQYFHGVTRIEADGGSGNDTIQVLPGAKSDVLLFGGSGNDVLSALGSGVATIYGGAGDDHLIGGNGDDHIEGGAGQDTIRGGSGNDTLYGFARPGIAVSGVDAKNRISGGAGDDVLFAGDRGDVLHGQSGNDLLAGGSGADEMDGGEGNDELLGKAGDDQLLGGLGADIIRGGDGNDRIQYAFIHQEDEDDPSPKADKLFGGAGIDTIEIRGSEAADAITIRQRTDLPADAKNSFIVTGSTYDSTNEEFVEVSEFEFSLPQATESDIEEVAINSLGGDDEITAEGSFTVQQLSLYGGDGDDTLLGGDTVNHLYGGEGHDTLLGGNASDQLYGEAGNDRLSGGGGVDALYGGAGDDHLDGGLGFDYLSGESGDDTLLGGEGMTGDSLNGGFGNDHLYGGSGKDSLQGGEGDDRVYGGAGDDTLRGGKGNDTLVGEAGIDMIYGDEGDDILFGELESVVEAFAQSDSPVAPEDQLYGGFGNDVLQGSNKFDAIFGEEGDDTIIHTGGNDIVLGGNGGNDTYVVRGTSGDDEFAAEFGGAGTPTEYVVLNGNRIKAGHAEIEQILLQGAGGNDHIELQPRVNSGRRINIDGGAGHDTISGGLSEAQNNGEYLERNLQLSDLQLKTDHLTYGLESVEHAELAGNSTDNMLDVSQFRGTTILDGKAGNDMFVTGFGNDEIYGGEGRDTIKTTGNVDITLDNIQLVGLGIALLNSIESGHLNGGAGDNKIDARGFSAGSVEIRGEGGNDYLYGSHGDDKIWGGAGNDWIEDGPGGRDYLFGGAGNDRLRGNGDYLYGEQGNDILRTRDGNSAITNIQSSGGDGDDQLYGGMGNDLLYGGNGNDKIFASAGHDTVYGQAGNDHLYGAAGNDTLYGGSGNDYVVGHAGNDKLYGESGNDSIHGADGHDYLSGGSGNDYIGGGTGADKLYGGSGRDRMYGDSGSDYLDGGRDNTEDYLNGGSGYDTIVQYRKWVPVLWWGHWNNQEKLVSADRVIYRGW
ncbi:MAG: hypothetical protein Aurels2KO_29750 [Aureliella sp.]